MDSTDCNDIVTMYGVVWTTTEQRHCQLTVSKTWQTCNDIASSVDDDKRNDDDVTEQQDNEPSADDSDLMISSL